jgi:hypothetical protein
VTQRYRIRWTKEGRTRFVSARDLTSVWERALRRVDLPIAYSEGFTPHAKVSFPDALPVGYGSTGEYAELTFAAPDRPRSGPRTAVRDPPRGDGHHDLPRGARRRAEAGAHAPGDPLGAGLAVRPTRPS